MSLDETIESYREYLLTLPEHRRQFEQRLQDHPPAARAEAAIFAFLRAEGCEPVLNEDPATGGADFCCGQPKPFVVEVTSIEDVVMAARAGTDADLPANGEGAYLDMEQVLNLVRTTVSNKAAQLANYPVPRLLAICSEYWGASMFFGPGGAAEIMYGGSIINVPVAADGVGAPAQLATELQEAPFFRIKKGVAEACRQSISALLLVHLDQNACHVVGLLHPAATIPFPISNLPTIPFGKVAWPTKTLQVEWMLGAPQQARFNHERVTLTNEELREGVQTSQNQCPPAH
ncbi:MAG TPA: hypothetical protein VLN59_07535 [Burkholderiales bacterium]|nr:hypothetical protein [Burkholderiales bacterium]